MSRGDQLKARSLQAAMRGYFWALSRMDDPIAALADPFVAADPYPFYDRLRDRGTVVASRLPATFASSSHHVVGEVLRSNAFGLKNDNSEQAAALIEPTPGIYHPLGPRSLLAIDPPDHTRLRRLVARPFTPRAVKGIESRVREVVDQTIDRYAADGQMDFMELAGTIPVVIICEILGVPTEDEAQFKQWGAAIAPTLDISLDPNHGAEGRAALGPLNAYFRELFARRRQEPGDAIVDGLLRAEDEEDRLDDAEVMTTALLVLVAGFETTVNLLGNGMLALLRNPEALALLQDDPGLAPKVVEETLRYDSPVQSTGRTAQRDVELDGHHLPSGTSVVTMLGGANREPSVFDRPDEFDLLRPNAGDHLSFGAGHHFCLGAPLARMEGTVAFERLAERLTDLQMTGRGRRRRTQNLRGLESLPISFTAR